MTIATSRSIQRQIDNKPVVFSFDEIQDCLSIVGDILQQSAFAQNSSILVQSFNVSGLTYTRNFEFWIEIARSKPNADYLGILGYGNRQTLGLIKLALKGYTDPLTDFSRDRSGQCTSISTKMAADWLNGLRSCSKSDDRPRDKRSALSRSEIGNLFNFKILVAN